MGKGNIDNLVKNEDLTPEQRRANASKAGKASAEARRKKKEFRELFELALSQPCEENPDIDNWMAVTIAMMKKAKSGDTKAFEALRDTIGQKPTDKIETEMKGDVSIQITIDD